MKSGQSLWRPRAQAPRLIPETVHVFRIDLRDGARAASLRPLLSPEELERADKFYFDHDRHAYIIARGALRLLLGGALGLDPRELRFGYGPHGKPFLDEAGNDMIRACGAEFNVSHSHELALIALTAGRRVGVDVEFMRPRVAEEPLAERFFSPREAAALRALPSPRRRQGFFAGWTRKEAFIKALGSGLSLALDSFDVSLDPDAPPELLELRGDAQAAGSCRVVALDPAPGYAGALVAQGHDWTLQCWDWMND